MKSVTLKFVTTAAGTALFFAGAANAAVYAQNFNGFADGTTNFADGSLVASNDGLASAQGGAFRIASDSISGQTSVYKVPGLTGASLGWTATFNITISDTLGENPPADGLSFSWGSIPFTNSLPPVDGVSGFGAEHGWQLGSAGDHISFEIDTWMNGGTDNGLRIASQVAGVHTHVAETPGIILNDGGSVSGLVTLSWSPTAGASMSTTGFVTNVNFTNVPVPGFTGSDTFVFAFASRTGNADETVLIDNLNITSVPEPSNTLLAGAAGLGLMAMRRRRR